MRNLTSFRSAGLAFLLGISSGPSSTAAQNEEIARTIRFDATRYTTAGELHGCGFEFSQVVPDHAYELGAPVILRGSVSTLYVRGKPLNVILKVKGQSMDQSEMTTKPFHVNYAYLSADGQSFAGMERASFRCEDGAFCATYVDGAENIIRAIFENTAMLSYNRNEGGLDVNAVLDSTQAIEAESNMRQGRACYRELFGRFRRQD